MNANVFNKRVSKAIWILGILTVAISFYLLHEVHRINDKPPVVIGLFYVSYFILSRKLFSTLKLALLKSEKSGFLKENNQIDWTHILGGAVIMPLISGFGTWLAFDLLLPLIEWIFNPS